MNEIKVLKLKIEVLSPLLISQPQAGRFFRNICNYLPGSTIRGSILTFLLRRGVDITPEENSPALIFHPGYPVINNVKARPIHPLTFKSKVDDNLMLPGGISDPTDLDEFRLEDLKIPFKDEDRYFVIEHVPSGLVYKSDDGFKEYTYDHVVLTSVGIHRALKTREVGMLYSYIAISPGVTFESYLVDESGGDRLSDFNLTNNTVIETYMGRGGSRGLGGVRVKFEEINVKDEILRVEDAISGFHKSIILRALSPIFSFEYVGSSPKLSVPFKERFVIGEKNFISAGSEVASGYSIKGGIPKPKIVGLKAGTLLFYEKPENLDVEELVKLEFLGVGLFAHCGLNIVEVYPYERGNPF